MKTTFEPLQGSQIESAPRLAFSVSEFCRLVGISQQLFLNCQCPIDR